MGRNSVVPPTTASTVPSEPIAYPELSASLRPPRLVKFASGRAIAAAPRTPNV